MWRHSYLRTLENGHRKLTTDWALSGFVRLEARYHILEQRHHKYFWRLVFTVLTLSLVDVRLCTRVRLQEPPELFIVPCSFS